MKKIVTIFIVLLVSLSFSKLPSTYKFERDKNFDNDHIHGNFILDIVTTPLTPENIYVATGDGLSVGDNLDESIDNFKWFNTVVGWGGSSAIAFSADKEVLWMATGKDSFVVDTDDFLPTGSGIHRSDDFGKTWKHFKQPGLTPIQGITYDLACDDKGQVWAACFGQSIQRSSDNGESWTPLSPDSIPWSPTSPLKYLNHRVFSVHHSVEDQMIVGSAGGINFLENYNVPDEDYVWKNFSYPQLTGNFVTHINSREYEGKSEIWAATWVAESQSEKNGVSYTNDGGETWNKTLVGEKIYSIDFSQDGVFASGSNGLWFRRDGSENFEKFDIRINDPMSMEVIEIERVYTFKEYDGKYFIGTPKGVAVSDDMGNSWKLFQGYKKPEVEDKEKTYAFPSPFSPSRHENVKIIFENRSSTKVTFKVFNFANEKVVTIKNGIVYEPGTHYLLWNGKDSDGDIVANGGYFYLLEYDGKKEWNKFFIFD
ncbi:MAG: hypothetical protein CR982_00655 [Candidatus Cloacimonadota bacterium]|nr:MAG: hypothetical protein CR982_00655 [Candidatus Cloacimonadota bacterium]PIE78441.1 MAG: hypothetical protein CSA15_07830 [Candidatus Delongbacteria bacterium]